jgi:muramoyltetrapeptide carboxypeptidase
LLLPARYPPPVGAGDRIGVAALSAPVDGERLERGLDGLRSLGFEPVAARNLRTRRGLFAGSDDDRLAAFHDLVADPHLAAIVFARGGHGVLRLLPRLDWEQLRQRPRAYVGYSDATPFLLEVVRRLGLVAFHGPMAAVEPARGLSTAEADSLLGCLAGEPGSVTVEPWLGESSVAAPLLGGCLSLLVATLGTEFATGFGGALLFWEDVGEPLYRLDRMLTQLHLAGALDGLRGMIVGAGVGAGDEAGLGQTLGEVLAELRGNAAWPVAFGCASGHCTPNLTLPLGAPARLDVTAGRLLLG